MIVTAMELLEWWCGQVMHARNATWVILTDCVSGPSFCSCMDVFLRFVPLGFAKCRQGFGGQSEKCSAHHSNHIATSIMAENGKGEEPAKVCGPATSVASGCLCNIENTAAVCEHGTYIHHL